LVVIDVQNGFMPGGGLPVPRRDEVVPIINRLAQRFARVVLTQDWHTADHVSFAVNHAGAAPFSSISLLYGELCA
jgi:nicotinamidase/pyrazinamidase